MSRAEHGPALPAGRPAPITRRRILQAAGAAGLSLALSSCVKGEEVGERVGQSSSLGIGPLPATAPEKAVTGAPTITDPRPVVVQVEPTESSFVPPERNWTSFQSLEYPYRINYPEGWIISSKMSGAKVVDMFGGGIVDGFQETVSVVAEPLNSWVRFEDFRDQIKGQLSQLLAQGGSREVVSDIGTTNIDGHEAQIFGVRVPAYVALVNPEYDMTVALFVANGQGWAIALSSNPIGTIHSQETFFRMLKTFRLIQER